MNGATINPTINSGYIQPGLKSGESTVRGTTPSGQAQPVPTTSNVAPWQPPIGFQNLPPALATPQTAGLFSSDPAIQAALSSPNMDFETLIELQIALNNKQMDTLTAGRMKEVEANQKTAEKNQAERIQQIKDSQVKLQSAEKKSWWSKLLNVVAKVAAVVVAVAMIAAAVIAAPVTGGASLALGLAGGYMLATSAYDLANEINVAVNGEEKRWPQVTLGSGVAWLLEKVGVDKDIAGWVSMGVDLAVNIAMMAIPGAQFTALPRLLKGGAMVISAIAQASKAGIDVSKAFDVKALADITAKLDTLQAQIDDLALNNKQLIELLKILNETKADNEGTMTQVLDNQASKNKTAFSMA
jgi:hypothetical protein